MAGEFPAQRTSNAENISIWWRHHDRVCGQAGPIWTANRLLHSSGAMAVRLSVWWDITSDWLSIMFQRPLTFPYTFSPYTYWYALAKLRTSSHNLDIERGRHTRPVTPADLRVCTARNVVEEEHWRLHRRHKICRWITFLFYEIVIAFPDFQNLNSVDNLDFLIRLQNPYISTLVEKFIYICVQ